MPENLTPANLAKSLAISANTVRRLTAAYADYLSDSATPPPGGRRIYTEEDVEVLGYVVELQNAGQSQEEIEETLASGILPARSAITPSYPPASLPTEATEALVAIARHLETLASRPDPTEALERLTATIEKQEMLRNVENPVVEDRLARLEEENADLRRHIGTPLLWMVLGAIIMGVIAAGIAIWLISI